MSWYFLDSAGNTKGPVLSTVILSKYHNRTGEITEATHIWNVERGVSQWTELSVVYNKVIDATINNIKNGSVGKLLLEKLMNPYDVYINKTIAIPKSRLPIGTAKVEIQYKGYLANIDNPDGIQLTHFIQNRETIQLGKKKNAYGLEMALYKIREGEQCDIYIPWRLAYGEKGAGNLIPPKTDILFELTMHQITEQGPKWGAPVRFDKWSKMKLKWNNAKSAQNMLNIKTNYDQPNVRPKSPVPPPVPANAIDTGSGVNVSKLLSNKANTNTNANMNANMNNMNNNGGGLPKANNNNNNSSVNKGGIANNPWMKKNKPMPPGRRKGKRKSNKYNGGNSSPAMNTYNNNNNNNNGLPKASAMNAYNNNNNNGLSTPSIMNNAQQINNMNMNNMKGTSIPPPASPKDAVVPKQSSTASVSFHSPMPPVNVPTVQSHSTHSNANTIANPISRQKRTKSITWDVWLKKQGVKDSMIQKLKDGEIQSWEELHAIEDDVDDVAKELGLKALEKVKLKALLRNLPKDLPQIEEPDPVQVQQPIALPPLPNPIPQQQPMQMQAVPTPIVQEEKIEEKLPPDEDDPRYLKTQIIYLKNENIELKKLTDDNGTKQQILESINNLYDKDVELQKLQNQLNKYKIDLNKKEIQINKLKKELILKDNINYIDIQTKLFNNYSNKMNDLLNKLAIDYDNNNNKVNNTMNDIKKSIKISANMLDKQLKSKNNLIIDNKKQIQNLNDKLGRLVFNDISPNDVDDNILSYRVDTIDDLMKKRKSQRIVIENNVNNLTSLSKEKLQIQTKIYSMCLNNKYNELFYKLFVQNMSIIFYDNRLIKSQFIQNKTPMLLDPLNKIDKYNYNVFCADSEKLISNIPLTSILLDFVRNGSDMDRLYDVLLLDKFTTNILEFERLFSSGNGEIFASLIGVYLTNNKITQNIIKTSQSNGIHDINIIKKEYESRVNVYISNLIYLIITGYGILILDILQKKSNNNYDYLEYFASLIVFHPSLLINSSVITVPASFQNGINKENLFNLNLVFKNICTPDLQKLINDYYDNFGNKEFIKSIINTARYNI